MNYSNKRKKGTNISSIYPAFNCTAFWLMLSFNINWNNNNERNIYNCIKREIVCSSKVIEQRESANQNKFLEKKNRKKKWEKFMFQGLVLARWRKSFVIKMIWTFNDWFLPGNVCLLLCFFFQILLWWTWTKSKWHKVLCSFLFLFFFGTIFICHCWKTNRRHHIKNEINWNQSNACLSKYLFTDWLSTSMYYILFHFHSDM